MSFSPDPPRTSAVDPNSETPTSRDALTPELALVSPELAEEAKGRLPDRPWEVETAAAERRTLAGQRLSASDAHAHRQRLVRRLVVAAVVVGGLVVGALGVDGDEPLIEGEARTTGTPAATSPDTRPEARRLLLPSAGYVVSPSGSFMTDPSGRLIRSFTLPVRCGQRPLVIENIPVPGASLRYTGRVMARAITVRLTGRVLDREHVRGVVVARGSSCSPGPVAFRARLS